MTAASARGANGAGLVRVAAIFAVVATLLGRVLAPALRGAVTGFDRAIALADRAGVVATQAFAVLGVVVATLELFAALRETRFGVGFRVVALLLAGSTISLFGRAVHEPLPGAWNVGLAIGSATLALACAREAVRVPRTRAMGVALAFASLAAGLHLAALVLAMRAGDEARVDLATLARALATASTLADGLVLATALGWISSRDGKLVSARTAVALLFAMVVAWAAVRGGLDGASSTEVVARRAVERLLLAPPPSFAPALRYFVEALSLGLAVVVLFVRRQLASVVSSFALVLVARPATDVPLAALALTIASLATARAVVDDRAMWALFLDREPARASRRA